MIQSMNTEKVENLLVNLYHKIEYFTYIRNLKRALNHGLVSKKVHRVIKFNQNAWPEPYVDINTDLRAKQKMIF